MYMADIKLFAKNQKEPETSIQIIRIHRRDIEMECIEKCAMFTMKSRKREVAEKIDRTN